MQNFWKTYNITGILRKRKICGKWCHSGNPLSRGCYWSNKYSTNNSLWQRVSRVTSLILLKYMTTEVTILRMLSKNDLPFSLKNLRKLYLADLQKTYENLKTNLVKSYIGPLLCYTRWHLWLFRDHDQLSMM